MIYINSIPLGTLFDPGSTRTFIRKDISERVLNSLGIEKGRSYRSTMVMANGSRNHVEGKVVSPLIIENITRPVSQGKFDLVFAAKTKRILMSNEEGEQHPLTTWLVNDKGACTN